MATRKSRARCSWHEDGTATDEWSGGREALLELWPGETFGPDAHEHAHHAGCYYWHTHPGGREPHDHQVPRECRNCGQSSPS